MTYIFFDKYYTLDDITRVEAESKEEALIKIINHALKCNIIDIDSILDSLDWELKALDEIKKC